jgi:small GTP-binding protein
MEYKFKIIILGDFGCGKTSLLQRITDNVFSYSYVSTIGVDYFIKRYSHNDIFNDQEVIRDNFSVTDGSCEISELKPKTKINIKTNRSNKLFTSRKTIANPNPNFKQYLRALSAVSKNNKNDVIYHLRLWDTSGQERFSKIVNAYYKNLCAAVILFDLTNLNTFQSVEKWHADLFDRIEESSRAYFPIILVGNKADLVSKRQVSKDKCIELANKLGCIYIECSVKDDFNIDTIFSDLIEELVLKINNEIITPNSSNGINIFHKQHEIEFNGKEEDTVDLESTDKKKCCIIS